MATADKNAIGSYIDQQADEKGMMAGLNEVSNTDQYNHATGMFLKAYSEENISGNLDTNQKIFAAAKDKLTDAATFLYNAAIQNGKSGTEASSIVKGYIDDNISALSIMKDGYDKDATSLKVAKFARAFDSLNYANAGNTATYIGEEYTSKVGIQGGINIRSDKDKKVSVDTKIDNWDIAKQGSLAFSLFAGTSLGQDEDLIRNTICSANSLSTFTIS